MMVLAARSTTVLPLCAALCCVTASARANEAAIEARGQGVQVYRCDPSPDGFGWHLLGPDAVLLDAAGARIGTHFAGPTWRANDGSSVTGSVVTSSPSPEAQAVPWLVLRAVSHAGTGAFASVTFIARVRTQGGAAPAEGCDPGHAGRQRRIPYSATYMLFRHTGPAS